MKNQQEQQRAAATGRVRGLWYAPLCVALALLLLLGGALYLNQHLQQRQLADLTYQVSARVKETTLLHFKGSQDLLRLVSRRMRKNSLDETAFVERGARYLAEHHCIDGLFWIPADKSIAWVCPESKASQYGGMPIDLPAQEKAWKAMLKSKRPAVTTVFENFEGQLNFEYFFPVYRDEDFIGAFAAAFPLHKALDHIIKPVLPPNIHVALQGPAGEHLYGLPEETELLYSAQQQIGFPTDQLPFRIVVTPHAELLSFAGVVLIALCIALTIGITVGMWRLRRENVARGLLAGELARHQEELAHLVEERTRALEQVNRELRLNEERLRLTLDATNDGLWDWDLSTQEVYFSPRYYTMLGYMDQEFPPSFDAWRDLLHPQDREAALRAVENHFTSDEAYFETEFRLREKAGTWRWIQARGRIVGYDAEGKPLRMAGTHVDISARKAAEEEAQKHQQQLLQADKMASLGLLVSGVAHEINNPNFLVMSNCQVLRNAWEGSAPILEHYYEEQGDFMIGGAPYSSMREEIPDLFAGILEGSDRIKHIVAELRDYAQDRPATLEDGIQMNDVVESSMALLANMIERATAHFDLDLGQDLPPLRANPQRIEQVIINLVQNACQALRRPEEAIRLCTRFDAEKNELYFEVRDEGVGIKEEDLPHLVDPFFTTKRSHGGTGLGLSISASIAKNHGGRLEFESDWGRGATARLILPAAQPLREEA